MSDDVPDLVIRAEERARELGLPQHRGPAGPSCCHPSVGRLLALLASRGGRIGEIGTGVGYGTAWMVSAMPTDATLVTIEIEQPRAEAAAELFADDDRVTVIRGDATALIGDLGPFDLLFADGAGYGGDARRLRSLFDLLAPGGSIVVDDVTPVAALPADSPFRSNDPKRAAFRGDPAISHLEVVAPDLSNSALVGTRPAGR